MTTITLRGTKGTPLTNSELDSNFSNLNTYKVEQTSATGAAALPSGTTAQRPASPVAGNIRYNASTGKFEGYGSAWGNIGGGAAIGDAAPSNPGAGDLWWNSLDGHLYVYYSDVDTSQWVDAFAGGEGQYLPLTGGTISGNLAYTGTLTGGTGIINIGSGQIYKDSSGNLGLGVTPSGWYSAAKTFQIGYAGAIYANTGVAQTKYLNNAYYNASGNPIYLNNGYAQDFSLNNSGQYTWSVAASGAAGNAISFTQAMTLDASGNLLVGTTSSSTGNGGFRIRINNSGIIGYTNVQTECQTNSNSYSTWDIYAAGAYRFYVGYAGTISAVSTTITGISDQRLKENIRDLDDGLAAILSLKPRKFDWKEGKGKDIKNDRGFIAQEFEQVFPDMIEAWADPAPEGEEPYKAVNANLIPTLVKAIQELSARLEALEAN